MFKKHRRVPKTAPKQSLIIDLARLLSRCTAKALRDMP
ncbi:hypothetical protein KPSA1_07599 [Pseudomonas syringae pv. actinidiae]|uniref:Uncharacterized protein n=1 Tax=Pseudomonas syringae pv. actinidiae TaxID=103796 RepID=A0A2V0QZQ8_PSESF|nr:hypothetical protein KPSA1_07599 [Pseudomonas syringae pv. actinidiae]